MIHLNVVFNQQGYLNKGTDIVTISNSAQHFSKDHHCQENHIHSALWISPRWYSCQGNPIHIPAVSFWTLFVLQAATKWHTFSLWVMPVKGGAEKAGWGTFANFNFISSLSFPFTPHVSYSHSHFHFIHDSCITLFQKPRCWVLGILIVLAPLFRSIGWSWRYQVHSSKNFSKAPTTHTHWYTWGEWSWMIF